MEGGHGNTWVGENFPWIVAFGGLLAVGLKRVLPHIDPRLILAWINAPLLRPVLDRLDSMDSKIERGFDKVHRVIDNMEGSEQAHAAVKAEENRSKSNWE